MAIDRTEIRRVLTEIGSHLPRPARLCVFGSAPAILLGQPARMTRDIDVWSPASDYLSNELEAACRAAGILFDPTNELAADRIYLQIVRPGVVRLPAQFDTQIIERFANLSIVAPMPALITAQKLVRFNERDVDDIIWWMSQSALDESDIIEAIKRMPARLDRETAQENLVVVRLIAKRPP